MKKVKHENENCIPTPTSCVEWNGGSIEYLGICDGDSLNNLLWEVIAKLQEIAGEDLSSFDIDSLLDICQQKAPLETNITSILTLLKNNQICLKDFIDTLNERLNELFQNTGVSINLKCYAEFDNQGNSLSITRETLDQLIIDQLCNHKGRIETLEGKITSLQNQVNDLNLTQTVEELSFDTCLDPGVDKPTSTNVLNLAEAHCDLEEATGDSGDINNALAQTPDYASLAPDVVSDPNYIIGAANLADNHNNVLIALENALARIQQIENTCCAFNCDDIKLGFNAVYNEDGDAIIVSFTWGAGTVIPEVFEDCGSTYVITDIDGNTVSGNIEVGNDSEDDLAITGLNTLQPLTVNITVKLCREGLTCQKCLIKTVSSAQCQYCTYTASGGSVAIIYTITNNIV